MPIKSRLEADMSINLFHVNTRVNAISSVFFHQFEELDSELNS